MKPDQTHNIPLMEMSSVTASEAEVITPSLSAGIFPDAIANTNDSAIIAPNTYDIKFPQNQFSPISRQVLTNLPLFGKLSSKDDKKG